VLEIPVNVGTDSIYVLFLTRCPAKRTLLEPASLLMHTLYSPALHRSAARGRLPKSGSQRGSWGYLFPVSSPAGRSLHGARTSGVSPADTKPRSAMVMATQPGCCRRTDES